MTLFTNVYKVAFCCTEGILELIKTDCDGTPKTAAMSSMLINFHGIDARHSSNNVNGNVYEQFT